MQWSRVCDCPAGKHVVKNGNRTRTKCGSARTPDFVFDSVLTRGLHYEGYLSGIGMGLALTYSGILILNRTESNLLADGHGYGMHDNGRKERSLTTIGGLVVLKLFISCELFCRIWRVGEMELRLIGFLCEERAWNQLVE